MMLIQGRILPPHQYFNPGFRYVRKYDATDATVYYFQCYSTLILKLLQTNVKWRQNAMWHGPEKCFRHDRLLFIIHKHIKWVKSYFKKWKQSGVNQEID
jgi:hypothetical protein